MHPIDKKILATRLAHLFLLAFSACIFTFQVGEIANLYFRYKTTTKMTFKSGNSPPPAVCLCIRYSDIMDWQAFSQTLSSGQQLHRSSHFLNYSMSMTYPTVQQIFEFTPAGNQSLDCILFRTQEDYLPQRLCGPQVYSVFSVSKYFVQEYMCYNYFIRNQTIIRFRRVVNSLHHAHLMFALELSDQMLGANRFHMTIFYQDDPTDRPGYSKMFGSITDRLQDFDQKVPLVSEFQFSYSTYMTIGLPAPYDTNCKPRDLTFDCTLDCLLNGYKMIDRVPFQIFMDEGMDLSRRHVNAADMGNQTTNDLIVRVDDRCNEQCHTTICVVSYTRTDLIDMSLKANKSEFSIRILAANRPDAIMESIPLIGLNDFVYYVCSCVTVWFGVSVYGMNPFAAAIQWLQGKKQFHYDPASMGHARNRAGRQQHI